MIDAIANKKHNEVMVMGAGDTLLGSFGGVMAGRMENTTNGAKTEARTAGHHAEMAEIAADNATDAANIAARNAHIGANNAKIAAEEANKAVLEGREQTQFIVDQLGKGIKEHVMPAIANNANAIAALTDLVKELHARLDKLQTQINKQE